MLALWPVAADRRHAYEVKWDGFCAIVSTEGPLRVRSRRGWDMTPHVGFPAQLPVRAVLDGELVDRHRATLLVLLPLLLRVFERLEGRFGERAEQWERPFALLQRRLARKR
jgi:ATP-dependent DNA ligase